MYTVESHDEVFKYHKNDPASEHLRPDVFNQVKHLVFAIKPTAKSKLALVEDFASL